MVYGIVVTFWGRWRVMAWPICNVAMLCRIEMLYLEREVRYKGGLSQRAALSLEAVRPHRQNKA